MARMRGGLKLLLWYNIIFTTLNYIDADIKLPNWNEGICAITRYCNSTYYSDMNIRPVRALGCVNPIFCLGCLMMEILLGLHC